MTTISVIASTKCEAIHLNSILNLLTSSLVELLAQLCYLRVCDVIIKAHHTVNDSVWSNFNNTVCNRLNELVVV